MCLCWMNVKEMCVKKNSGEEKKKRFVEDTEKDTSDRTRVLQESPETHTVYSAVCSGWW